MTDQVRALLNALRDAAAAQQEVQQALVLAAEHNRQTGQAMVAAIEAALTARDEQDSEVADAVARLEEIVLELRERMNRLNNRGGA